MCLKYEAPYDLFVVFSIKAVPFTVVDWSDILQTPADTSSWNSALVTTAIQSKALQHRFAASPGSRDHGLLWFFLYLRAFWLKMWAKVFLKEQPKFLLKIGNNRGKGKTLQGGMHCCRNYVSEEYGMSDEEAGNLYAAYGFACTGSECVLEATQESS